MLHLSRGERLANAISNAVKGRRRVAHEERVRLRTELVTSATLCAHEFGFRATAKSLRLMADRLEKGLA